MKNNLQSNIFFNDYQLSLNEKEKPYFIMMVGLPGSGKSYYAENQIRISKDYPTGTYPKDNKKIHFNITLSTHLLIPPTIHSSDKLRHELYGDAAIQGDNQALFNQLHKNIINDLSNGESVIYDATNIKKSLRIDFLQRIRKIDCEKICVVMATPYEKCLKRCDERPTDEFRTQKVPPNVVKKMYFNYMPPHKHEGFDDIYYVFDKSIVDTYSETYNLMNYLFRTAYFDQENSHHAFSLGGHSIMAVDYVDQDEIAAKVKNNFDLFKFATVLHDNGKEHTKTKVNFKGIDDGECHYYQHQCVGAYEAMFYCFIDEEDSDEMSYVCNLIYYHMHPYMSWNRSEKSRNRDLKLLGEDLYNDIMLLHEADAAAH